jgi:hypothetical protein
MVPKSAPKRLPKLGGPFLAALGSFAGGYEGANAVMRLVGVPEDMVGFEALLPMDPAPEYEVDSDWTTTPDTGWVPGSSVTYQGTAYPTMLTMAPDPVPLVQWKDPTDGVSEKFAGYASGPLSPYPTRQSFAFSCKYIKGDGSPGTMGAGGNMDTRSDLSRDQSFSCLTSWLPASGVREYLDRAEVYQDGQLAGKIVWYPPGHASRPAAGESSPERRFQTRWSCSGGAGGVEVSALFRETDAEWPAFPDAVCAPGTGRVVSVEVWQVVPGDSSLDVLLDSWTENAGQAAWETDYPECTDGSCVLELARVDQGSRLDCFGSPEACVDWWGTPEPTRSERYECRYAGQVVSVAECKVYSPTFNVATNTPVVTSTGTVPATTVGRLADPATGEPVPNENPAGGTDPAEDDGCPPSFNATNFLNGYWIYKGVACALSAAFVPTQTGPAIDAVGAAAAGSTPFPEVASVVTWFAPPSSLPPQCLVLDVSAPAVIGADVVAFDSCGQGPAEVWLRDHRWLTGIAVWAGLVFPILWWVWRQYAPGSTGVA